MENIITNLKDNLKKLDAICIKNNIFIESMSDEELKERIDFLYNKVINHD